MPDGNAPETTHRSGLLDDIKSMIEALDEPSEPAVGPEQRFRVVVATDWSNATLPYVALQAFSQMMGPHAPVELVFAVPHEPGEIDLGALATVYEALPEGTTVPALGVESFEQAGSRHAYAAIVPNGDARAGTIELGHFLIALHHLSITVGDEEKLRDEPVPVDGPNLGLRRRFTEFREVAIPSA